MKDFCTMGCNNCDLSKDSKNEIERIKKEARKEFADKIRIETGRLKSMNTFKNIDEFYDLIDNLLKEYEEE